MQNETLELIRDTLIKLEGKETVDEYNNPEFAYLFAGQNKKTPIGQLLEKQAFIENSLNVATLPRLYSGNELTDKLNYNRRAIMEGVKISDLGLAFLEQIRDEDSWQKFKNLVDEDVLNFAPGWFWLYQAKSLKTNLNHAVIPSCFNHFKG